MTLSEVKRQVEVACRGVASHVEKMQKETGVKDTFTQSWIEKLIGWSRERQRSGEDGRPVAEVEAELMGFVDAHSDLVYNPFLTAKCEHIH